MKKLGIFYFSGTGNTEIVTNNIAKDFTKLGWNVEVIRIEDVNKNKVQLNIDKYDMIGIGCQVIAFSIPRVVSKFAKAMPKVSDNKKTFIFRTAGGVAPSNYNASKKLISILNSKKYDVCYEEIFSIGSNWIFKFDDTIMKQLYIATTRKIAEMCTAIDSNERHIYRTGLFLRIKMGTLATLSSILLPLLCKDAVVNSSCSKCGLCVKRCPAENISIKNGKVKFHSSCSACLRCIYSCPNHAISLKSLNFVIIKDGYDVNKSLSVDGNPDEKPNGKIPPFFYSYINS